MKAIDQDSKQLAEALIDGSIQLASGTPWPAPIDDLDRLV